MREFMSVLADMDLPGSDPQFVLDRSSIVMPSLRHRVARVVDYASLYAQAMEYMNQDMNLHPLVAFARAVTYSTDPLLGGSLSDHEIAELVRAWRQMCDTNN